MKNLLEKLKAFFSRKNGTETSQSGSEFAENAAGEKQPGRFKRLCLNIKAYAKRKPSTFIAIIVGIVFVLLLVTYEALHLTSTPEFCGMCHVETETGAGAEYHTWKKNIHAAANVGCIDCHGKPGFFGYMRAKMGGMYDLYSEIVHSKENKMAILTEGATNKEYAAKLVPNDWCLICHSDDENKRIRENTFMSFFGVKMRKVDAVKNPEFRELNGLRDIYNDEMPNISFSHDNHVNTLGLSCIECHMGVAHGGEFQNKTKMEDCFTCHDAEREKNPEIIAPANDDCGTCHTTVVAMHEGTLLLEEGEEPTPPSMMVDQGVYGAENCFSCHMEGAFDLPTAATCGPTCHSEGMDYGFMYDDIRAQFDAAKAPLDTLNMQLYGVLDKMTKEQRAKFNEFKNYYEILVNDKSKGIHNDSIYIKAAEKATAIGNELASSLGIPVAAPEEGQE